MNKRPEMPVWRILLYCVVITAAIMLLGYFSTR